MFALPCFSQESRASLERYRTVASRTNMILMNKLVILNSSEGMRWIIIVYNLTDVIGNVERSVIRDLPLALEARQRHIA